MVFIPGGGFVSGTTRNPWYDGAALASHGVTVVTLQYRVGPFGWLDLSSLGGDYAQSMNNGLLDQMAALRWVRENIARFGGDAKNVTLFGESAGAISISALLGAPSADSLYDNVILESGTSGTVATREWSTQVASTFEELAGVPGPQEVLSMSTQQVLDAAERVYASQFSDTAFHPVIDGKLVPAAPMDRLSQPTGPTKPIIMGTNLDEARYWYYYVPELARLPHSFYVPWLQSLVGDRAEDVWRTYQQARPGLDDAEIGLAIAGDVGSACRRSGWPRRSAHAAYRCACTSRRCPPSTSTAPWDRRTPSSCPTCSARRRRRTRSSPTTRRVRRSRVACRTSGRASPRRGRRAPPA